jgi:hypothetical protein
MKTGIGYKELTIARIKGGKIDGFCSWQFICIGSSVVYSIDYCRGSLLLLIRYSKQKSRIRPVFFVYKKAQFNILPNPRHFYGKPAH